MSKKSNIKNKSNVKKNTKKKVTISKGFTLIELLATISVLSLITTIVVYVAINVIGDAKETSYKVTINNVQGDANNYIIEEITSTKWRDIAGSSAQYQCITVQNLIDAGYFKGDALDSEVADGENLQASDYIYLERNKNTKAVTKNILLVGDVGKNYGSLCGQINADGEITFVATPTGWSKKKDVEINYEIFNNIDIYSNYNYTYDFESVSGNDKRDGGDTFANTYASVDVNDIRENGSILATIKKDDGSIAQKTYDVDKIDTIGPEITWQYNSSAEIVLSNNVTISFVVTDIGSGVDTGSFIRDDIVVKVGGTTLTSGVTLTHTGNAKYNLVISNSSYLGEVELTIGQNKVLDKVGNGNDKLVITPGITFKKVYTIAYDANTGTGSMEDTPCTYGKACTLRRNLFTKTGYSFSNWTSTLNTTVRYADGESVTNLTDVNNGKVTLSALWSANTYRVTADANGGTISSTEGWIVATDNTKATKTVTYNSNYGTLPTSGQTGSTFMGWYTAKSGGTEVKDNTKVTTANDHTIYAHWTANTYKIEYNANGGSGSMADTSCTYGSNCTLSSNSFKRDGYTFIGWSTSSSATSPAYSNTDSVSNLTDVNNGKVTMYAVWSDNTPPTITFGTNGSSTWKKSVSSTITVADTGSGVDTGTLKYIFSKSTSTDPTKSFTNGGKVSLSGVDGMYYLIAKACDKAGNCKTEVSKPFKLDNTPPVLTCRVGNKVTIKHYKLDDDGDLIWKNGNRVIAHTQTVTVTKQGNNCMGYHQLMFQKTQYSHILDCSDAFTATDENGINSSSCAGGTHYDDDGNTQCYKYTGGYDANGNKDSDNCIRMATACNCIHNDGDINGDGVADGSYCTVERIYTVYDEAGNMAQDTFVTKVYYNDPDYKNSYLRDKYCKAGTHQSNNSNVKEYP